MSDHTPVTVLHITMQGSIKLAHVRTTEGQTGYVKFQHVQPDKRRLKRG